MRLHTLFKHTGRCEQGVIYTVIRLLGSRRSDVISALSPGTIVLVPTAPGVQHLNGYNTQNSLRKIMPVTWVVAASCIWELLCYFQAVVLHWATGKKASITLPHLESPLVSGLLYYTNVSCGAEYNTSKTNRFCNIA